MDTLPVIVRRPENILWSSQPVLRPRFCHLAGIISPFYRPRAHTAGGLVHGPECRFGDLLCPVHGCYPRGGYNIRKYQHRSWHILRHDALHLALRGLVPEAAAYPEKVHRRFSAGYQGFRKYFSRFINSRRDRFAETAMTRVVWHENVKSGRNQVDHTYLIDVSEEIEIQQVDEHKWKVSDRALLPPPHPKTHYFELVIREFKEDGVSLIDDLQVYPVLVAGKAGPGQKKNRGALKIAKRIYEKSDTAEIQWIYSHDFHIFAIIHAEDTLKQMVDRVIAKLDEIVTSIKSGSRISSHIEETQKLKDEFETVLERPRRIPAGARGAAKPADSKGLYLPDRRRSPEAPGRYRTGPQGHRGNRRNLPQFRPDDYHY